MKGGCCFFFFQAEDGIRDSSVTGVQTCALPISDSRAVTCCRAPCRTSRAPNTSPFPLTSASELSPGARRRGRRAARLSADARAYGHAVGRGRVSHRGTYPRHPAPARHAARGAAGPRVGPGGLLRQLRVAVEPALRPVLGGERGLLLSHRRARAC